jgi:hypothetical protein
MMHQETYEGHSIVAETDRRGKKNCGCSYQIDGGELRERRERPLRHESMALSEAVREAKAVIDRMKCGGPLT